MAESVGKIKCPFSGCVEVAELKTDKRKKYFITCPVHGRVPFNTNKAQAEIRKLIEAGEASENVGGVVVGLDPENPEPEKADIPEKTDIHEDENENGRGGLVLIIIGFVLGIGSWLWKRVN